MLQDWLAGRPHWSQSRRNRDLPVDRNDSWLVNKQYQHLEISRAIRNGTGSMIVTHNTQGRELKRNELNGHKRGKERTIVIEDRRDCAGREKGD